MLVIFIIISSLFSPSETKLFKTLYLIKYSQEYNLYKNDINFNELELEKIIKVQIENRLLLYKEAKSKVIFDKDKYLQKIFDLKQEYNINSLELIAIRNNIPKKIILKNLEIDTYIESFLNLLFQNVKITENEIKNYYYSNLKKYTINKKILLYNIFSKSKPNILNIYKKLENKKNSFENLAYKYSESPEKSNNGCLGWVSKKDLPSYFSPAFKIKKGKYSKIIQSSIGFHIFFVKDIKTNQYININDVKKNIILNLRSEKQQKIINDFLLKKRKLLTE